jgi:DNA repair exonuclease SbcCD ATPase subunit
MKHIILVAAGALALLVVLTTVGPRKPLPGGGAAQAQSAPDVKISRMLAVSITDEVDEPCPEWEEEQPQAAQAPEAASLPDQPNLDALDRQIAELQTQIQTRDQELSSLEQELKRSAELARMSSSSDPRVLESKLNELRQLLEEKRRALAGVENVLRNREQELRNELNKLPRIVGLKQQELESLHEDVEQTHSAPVHATAQAFWSSKSAAFTFQLVGNRLYPIDDDHFEITSRGFVERKKERLTAVRFSRKRDAAGDDITSVAKQGSALTRVLSTLDPERTRVILLVHPDSYPMLRKAIAQVQQKGFEAGWWPDQRHSYAVYAGSGGFTVPSTSATTD